MKLEPAGHLKLEPGEQPKTVNASIMDARPICYDLGRREGESFEDYKQRRKEQNRQIYNQHYGALRRLD